MWRWLTELDEIPITPGLTDMPTWIDDRDSPGSASRPTTTSGEEPT